ncbi:MAG: hypothetical protein KBS84_02035 [Treponema sp.]|nr:hypothetical protein [Candidatus Treponema scatequi]
MEFLRTVFSKKLLISALIFGALAGNVWGADGNYYWLATNSNCSWSTAAWKTSDTNGGTKRDAEAAPGVTANPNAFVYADHEITVTVDQDIQIGTLQSDSNITISVSDGKTLTIGNLQNQTGTNKTITINIGTNGVLKLNNAIKSTGGTLKITGDGKLDLSGYTGSPDQFTAAAGLTITGTKWTGAIDDDWSKPGNWLGITDISQLENLETVTIPSGCAHYPSATDITLNGELVIEAGAALNLSGTSSINKITAAATSTITASGTITATSVSIDGTSILNGTITTTGTAGQSYTGAVTLTGDTTFDSGVTGPVKFLSSVTGANRTLTLKGATTYSGNITVNKWNNEGYTVLYETGKTPTVTVSSEVNGNNTFYNLTAGSGSTSITFEAGKTQTVNGTFTVSGSAASKTTIQSSTADTKWNLKVAADKAEITNAIIKDTQITDSVVIYLGSDKGCIYGGNSTTSNDGLMISSDYQWKTTAVDNTVVNPANWSVYDGSTYIDAVVPPYTSDDKITIQSSNKNPDFGEAQDFTCKSLTLKNTGANFKISSAKNIIVTEGSITNYGKIIYSSTGRITNSSGDIIMDGAHGTVEYTTGAGQISNCNGTGENDYYNLIVSATLPFEGGHQITIGHDFTLENDCDIGAGGQSLHIAGASSIGGNITTGHSQTYGGAVTFTTASSELLATNSGTDTSGNPYRTYFGSTITGKTGGTALTFNDAAFSSSTTMTNISTLTVNETTANSGTITTTGAQTYTGAVTNTGTINVPNTGNGTTAISFNSDYNGTDGSLIGNLTSNPAIKFNGGDVTFGTFTHNGDKLLFSTGTTNINSNVTAQNFEISTGATVTGKSATITVQNNWTGTGTFTPNTSTVIVGGNITGNNNFTNLTINGTGTSSILGQHTIDTFECTAAGKTLSFEAGKKQTISTKLQIQGTAANPITLQSSTDGTPWQIDCSSVAAANKTVSYATVKDSTADISKITAANSISLGNNTNWIIAGTYRWTGHSSDAWALAENWSVLQFNGSYAQAATYPGQFGTADTAYISSAYLETGKDYPSHSTTADIIIDNLIIGDATHTGKLTLSSSGSIRLVTASTFKNYGTIIYSSSGRIKNNAATPAVISDAANGTVEFSGSSATVDNIGTGDDYNNLVISGSVTLGDAIKVHGTFKNTAVITAGTSLEVTGTSSIGANITTTGNQTFTGAASLTAATVSLNAGTGTTKFNSTLTGPATATALTIQNVNFAGAVTNISTLTVNGTTDNAGTITTTGAQTYTGAVTNTGTINVPNITGNGVIFNGGFSGGTLAESTSADTNIVFAGGAVTIGTFNNTNNTVVFGDNANITLNADGKTFKNIKVDTNTHSLTLTNGNTINVSGNWVHTSGTVTATGTTLKVDGNVSGTNAFNNLELKGNLAGNHTITKLTITGAAASNSNITGSNTIGTFVCSTGKKTITFTAGTTQRVNTALTLSASAGNEINLQSSTAGTKWKIDASAATKNVSNVKVKDSESLTDIIEASSSLSLGNNVNWIIAQNFVWTGASSTAWTTAGNWKTTFNGADAANPATEYPGQLSTEDTVTIGATATNQPTFSTAEITIKSLSINDAARIFTFSSASDIKVKDGTITNKGKIVYSNTGRIKNNEATPAVIMDATQGTVEFAGTGLTIDDINATGNDYHNLVVSGTATLNGDIKAGGTLTTTAAITAGTSLEVTGTSSIGANITTTNKQTYTGNSTLTANVTLKSTSAADANKVIQFTNNLNSDATPRDLSVTGKLITKIVGNNKHLNKLEVTGNFESLTGQTGSVYCDDDFTISGTAVFRGNVNAKNVSVADATTFGYATAKITTTENQTYTGPAVQNTNETNSTLKLISTSATGTVTFGSTLDRYDTATPNLEIGDATNATKAIFNNNVANFTSLKVYGPTVLQGTITSIQTTSAQTYTGEVTAENDIVLTAGAASAITLSSSYTAVTGKDLTINSGLTTQTGPLTVTDLTLNNASTYTNTTAAAVISVNDITINSTSQVTFGTNKITANKITVAATGAKFTQTGANPEANTQTVAYLDNSGSMVWDSSAAGGSLTITGTGTDVIKSSDINHLIVFNQKNVTIGTAYISGIFYDLTIPAGITFTNNLAIVVRRNLTINGTYADNSKTLYLGQFTSGGTSYTSIAGTIGGSTTANPVNLGAVTINQQTTAKTFNLPLSITTLTCQDATATAGDLNFTKNITVANAATGTAALTTKSNYIFGSAGSPVTVNFQKGVAFNQPRGVSLNGTFKASTSGGIDINGTLTLTGNSTIETTSTGAAGKIKLVTVTGTTSELSITPTAGNIEISSTVSVAKMTVSNSSSFIAGGNITATNGFTLTGNGSGTIKNKISTANSDILFNSAAASAGVITLNGNTTFETGTGSGNVILNQPFSSNGAHTFEISTGTGDILIESSIGTATQALGAITLKGNTFISNTSVINSGTANITVGTDAAPKDLYISARNGTTAQDVTFKAGTLDVKGNIALFNGNVTLNANMTAGKDIILLKGNVNSMYKDSQSNISNLFDYHNSLRTADNKLCPPSLVYTAPGSATPTASKYPERFPDSATHTITHTGDNTYISSLTGFAGKTITAKQNFYDNGVNLTSTAAWDLKIKANDNARDSFAEAYNASISYCKVSCTTTNGFAWLSAGENCTNSGNNNTEPDDEIRYNLNPTVITGVYTRTLTGVSFQHPKILTNNSSYSASEGRTTGPEIPNFSGTYSVRDNVIRIEFVRNDDINKHTLIENSNNEITRAMTNFPSGRTIKVNGSNKTFETGKAYIDAECTESTDGKGDLAVFYIKATDITWNLSATGINAGADSDSHGDHQSNTTDLTIERAFAEAFYTLTDHHKNRISNYKAAPTSTPSDAEGFRFTATATRCATNDMYISFAIADFTSNAIYLFFDQPVAFDNNIWNDDGQANRTKTAIKIISAIGSTTAVRTVDSVEQIPNTQYGLKLTLNQPLTYEMITHGILIQYGGSFLLENKIHSTHQVAKVVRDGETHCISDVITNCVEVQYAYDNRNDTYIDSTGGLAPEDSIVMRNFTGEGRNNKVFSDKDITLVTKNVAPKDGGNNDAPFTYKLVADITPTPYSDGTLFNEYSGRKTRFWFPSYSQGGTNYTAPISGFAQTRNLSTNITTSDSEYIDITPVAGSTTITYLFHNFHENTPCLNWPSGSNVNFFFEATRNGTSYTINHKYQAGSGEITPLYCLRLKDPLDPTSIDLWSFIMSEPKRQRGGATIYSNVINAANKDFCTLEVDMPKDGNLRVIIMTADGNIVKYLENGRQTRGLHYYYWNGTNNAGDTVARGIYFIRVVGPDIEETRKVMVVK